MTLRNDVWCATAWRCNEWLIVQTETDPLRFKVLERLDDELVRWGETFSFHTAETMVRELQAKKRVEAATAQRLD